MKKFRTLREGWNRRAGDVLLLLFASCVALVNGGCAGLAGSPPPGNNPPPSNLSISNPAATGVTLTSATMSWQTNAPATSQVEYGTTTSYGTTTTLDSTLVTSHQQSVTSLRPGTLYHYRLRSKDANNNQAMSGDLTVTTIADTTPPTVSITSPAANATLAGAVAVTATASDNVGVAGVQFKVDNANSGAELMASPFTYTLNSTTLSNGNHVLTAVARDAANNTTTSAGVAVKVDNTTPDTTPPTVSISAPAGGATVSGTVTVSATASDNVGVASVQFQLDSANLGGLDTTSPYSISWDSTTASNGSHTLRAIAKDAAGNATTSAAVTVTVSNTTPDTTPPTVSISAPAGGATVSGTVTVSANASDNVGVASVQCQLDGANLGSLDTAAPYSYSWNSTTASNGSHTLRAIAKDAAGNATTSAAVTVTVSNTTPDTTAPTVSMTAPANSATVSGTVTVSANASDNVGVASVQFQLDGANLGALDTTSPYSISWDSTTASNGSHTLTALARDAAGNSAVSAAVFATVDNTTPPPSGSADFQTRCGAAGVILCNGFDSPADIAGGYGNWRGTFVAGDGVRVPQIDAALMASGGGSIKFTVPSLSGANSSGSFFTNFSQDLSVQFDSCNTDPNNCEFYVQWRQRFSPEFVTTHYAGGGGWKQADFSEGDRTGMVAGSCSDIEVVIQNVNFAGVPRTYHSCGGKDGSYEPLEYWDSILGNVVVQNAVGCLYPSYIAPPCVNYQSNQWMTFQVHIKIGTWYQDNNVYKHDSVVQLWVGYEGQASKLVLDFSPQPGSAGLACQQQQTSIPGCKTGYDLYNGNIGVTKYGKLWLLPYDTAKDGSVSYPEAYTWYDELVISRNKIADPQ